MNNKYSIGSVVYFMYQNKIINGYVCGLHILVDFPMAENGVDTTRINNTEINYNVQDKQGNKHYVMLAEHQLFPSKEDLIKSL